MHDCNIEDIDLINNPYLVQYSDNVKFAIKFAIEGGLLELYGIDYLIIDDYFNKKSNIPIWIVNAACKTNLMYKEIPINYQYLWFCLHNSFLIRKQPSGRIFRIKVNFTSCYLTLDDRIRLLMTNACKILNLPVYKFAKLCGYKRLNLNGTVIPLTAVIKICHVLNLDVWKTLGEYELFSKTHRGGRIFIPKNEKNLDLITLLVWLRTEGHLELRSTHIEINQMNSIKSLNLLNSLFVRTFNLNETSVVYAKGARGEDRLIISSSPLRQYLVLSLNLPLGYKSGSLLPLDFNDMTVEDCIHIAPAFIQTEGSLSYHYSRNKKKKLPRFEFIVKDKCLANDCLFLLESLGYKPHFTYNQNLYKVGMYNSKEVISLVNKSKEFMFDLKKMINLKDNCTNGIGL